MNADSGLPLPPNPEQPSGSAVAARTGLPPVEPPSGKFIAQLFLVPGLIVLVVVCLLLGGHWLFGGPQSPEQFLKKLDDSNAEIRWRAAADLSQVLPRDDQMAANASFALDLTERLQQAMRRTAPLEKALLERQRAPAPEATDPDLKTREDERKVLLFLSSSLGHFVVPVGAPLLRELATTPTDAAELGEIRARRRQAVLALWMLGDNVRKFAKLAPERQAQILDTLKEQSTAGGARGQWAEQAYFFLKDLQVGRDSPVLQVDRTLVECASDDDTFLRKQVASALTYWPGPRVEETLLRLLHDDGHGNTDDRPREVEQRDIRYNAAQTLARLGSDQALQAFGLYREMLDEPKQLELWSLKEGDQTLAQDAFARELILYTLKALQQLHTKNPKLDLSPLRPAIDQLAQSKNLALSNEAKQTQLVLDGNR